MLESKPQKFTIRASAYGHCTIHSLHTHTYTHTCTHAPIRTHTHPYTHAHLDLLRGNILLVVFVSWLIKNLSVQILKMWLGRDANQPTLAWDRIRKKQGPFLTHHGKVCTQPPYSLETPLPLPPLHPGAGKWLARHPLAEGTPRYPPCPPRPSSKPDLRAHAFKNKDVSGYKMARAIRELNK
jgi:hypothetical protein